MCLSIKHWEYFNKTCYNMYRHIEYLYEKYNDKKSVKNIDSFLFILFLNKLNVLA